MLRPRFYCAAALAATLVLVAAPACSQPADVPATAAVRSSLAEARERHTTKIVRSGDREPAMPAPPAGVFNLVKFPSPVGKLGAYVTPDPGDGKRHPAIVWITGGDSNSVSEMWSPQPRDNDQSAAAYRKAGIVTMFPSLRGGNDNPGQREGFYGEVNDVIAAARYLATLPYVDPDRIYLGGHSTGGTLAMLVAESTDIFRATFAFGPVSDPSTYGAWAVFHAPHVLKEILLRSPAMWLAAVRRPLYVLEGMKDGNGKDLEDMRDLNRNSAIRFLPVPNKTHFNVLAPANELIAARIAATPAVAADQVLTAADVARIGER